MNVHTSMRLDSFSRVGISGEWESIETHPLSCKRACGARRGAVSTTEKRLPGASTEPASKSSQNSEGILYPLLRKSWLSSYISLLCHILLKPYPLGKIKNLGLVFHVKRVFPPFISRYRMSHWFPRVKLS